MAIVEVKKNTKSVQECLNIRDVIGRLNPYAHEMPVRKYPSHLISNSLGVYELPNGIVKKVYSPSRASHRRRFDHERQILEHLTRNQCLHTPKLLFVDEKNTTLYMSNCGNRATNPSKRKLDVIMHELETKFGLSYLPNEGKKIYGYLAHSITEKIGKIFIIDFHGPLWSIRPINTIPANSPIQTS